MNILFVTDPMPGMQPEIDATAGLMAATEELGAAVWCSQPEDLAVVEGRVRARARPIRLRPRRRGTDHRWVVDVAWYDEGEPADLDVADAVELVVLRIDPPVDSRYLHTTYLLDLVEAAGTAVANRPGGIRAMHEKLSALRVSALCPPTMVASDVTRLREFVAQVRVVVLKPIDGYAGADVWKVRDDDAALALLESATSGGRRQVIAQEYLPAVERGNKRLFVVGGQIVGAVWRRPTFDDFRIGPPLEAAETEPADEEIVAAVGPALTRHGIALAGLDVIGGRLIEVNVTCPGGMAKADALLGTDLSGTVMRHLLQHASSPLEKVLA